MAVTGRSAGTLVREPAVAGRFYPAGRAALERAVDRCLAEARARLGPGGRPAPRAIPGVAAPHAGVSYSGAVAAAVFDRVEIPARVLIIGPNHTGLGEDLSIFPPRAVWRMPQGDVEIDAELTEALLAHAPPGLVADQEAHRREHGIEVELPFLQRLATAPFRIAAVVLGTRAPAVMRALGAAIARALADLGDRVLVVASTDMNHFEDQETTLTKDQLAIDRMLALDAEGLLEVCRRERISMCGQGPTAATLHALGARGLDRAELVWHRTSGDRDGERERVVGYAGVLFG
jgi:hypothetical protein